MLMSYGETPDFPEFSEYRVRNVWAAPQLGLARFVRKLLSGPVDVGGQDVDYRKVDINLRDTADWGRFPGLSAKASPGIRRTWRHAACLALPAALIKEVEKIYGGDDAEHNVRHAVARVNSSGDVLAGPLPEGVRFGTFSPCGGEETERRTLLCRVGPRSVLEIVTPALLLPQEGKLLVPDKVEVLDQNVHLLNGLWTLRTGTPVV